MDTQAKVEFIRDNFKIIDQLVTLHPLDGLSAYIRGLLAAWNLDGSIRWEEVSRLSIELEQLSNNVRNRFENNEG